MWTELVILLSLWETLSLAAHWRVRQRPQNHFSNVSVPQNTSAIGWRSYVSIEHQM